MTSAIEAQSGNASRRRFKKRYLSLTLTVLVALAFVLPPFVTLNRYKARLAGSVSNGLGRSVTVGDIHLRLLPRPGLDINRLIVADDPAFSAEPFLRADTVTAYLSLTSLWRGRLEISRLNLNDPSINLVRRPDGRWNLETLLERAQQVPSAPTGHVVESRLRFPYIEADDARINLKLGQQKSIYALSEADISFWQASEQDWQMRLEARPIRTDASLSDVGTLKVSGSFQRVSQGMTPFHIDAALVDSQLGQVTHLLHGHDAGWRGSVNLAASAGGTLDHMDWTTDFRLTDFRRYDIRQTDATDLRLHCTAKYRDEPAAPQTLSAIDCRSQVSPGDLHLTGDIGHLFSGPAPNLGLMITRWPVNSLAALARHAKKSIATDLSAEGEMEGALRISGFSPIEAEGEFSLHDVTLRSQTLQPALRLGALRFVVDHSTGKKSSRQEPGPSVLRLAMLPVALEAKADSSPRTFLSGNLTPEGITMELRGQADVQRALAAAETLGFHPPDVDIAGTLDGNVTVEHPWREGFSGPNIAGKLSINGLRLERTGALFPVTADFATIEFSPSGSTLWAQDARLGTTGLHARGSLTIPNSCQPRADKADCPLHFDLALDEVRLEELAQVLATPVAGKGWFSFGRRERNSNAWLTTPSEGNITVARLLARNMAFDHLKARLTLDSGNVALNEVHAQSFGGTVTGTWAGDFTGKSPRFTGSGKVINASLDRLGNAFWPVAWADSPARGGVVDLDYEVVLHGATVGELRQDATGSFTLNWGGGALSSTRPPGRSLRVTKADSRIQLADSTLSLQDGKLQTNSGTYRVKGTISFDRVFDLALSSPQGATVSVKKTLRPPEPVKSASLQRNP